MKRVKGSYKMPGYTKLIKISWGNRLYPMQSNLKITGKSKMNIFHVHKPFFSLSGILEMDNRFPHFEYPKLRIIQH